MKLRNNMSSIYNVEGVFSIYLYLYIRGYRRKVRGGCICYNHVHLGEPFA